MRVKQSSFLFSCHLKASSVINTGDYSEVYANVWWMWCSVPIKICCHAAQTTGIHNHCVTESSGFLEPHLSKALAVNQIWRDDIWTRGQCGVNIAPRQSWSMRVWAIVAGVDRVCPTPGWWPSLDTRQMAPGGQARSPGPDTEQTLRLRLNMKCCLFARSSICFSVSIESNQKPTQSSQVYPNSTWDENTLFEGVWLMSQWNCISGNKS